MSTKAKKTVKATTKAKAVKAAVKPATKATKTVATKSKTVKVVAKAAPAKTVSKKAKTSNRNTIAVIQLTPRGRRKRVLRVPSIKENDEYNTRNGHERIFD